MQLIWGYTVNRLIQYEWVTEEHEPKDARALLYLELFYPNKNVVTGKPAQPTIYLDPYNPDCIGYVGSSYARILADDKRSIYNMLKSMYHEIERRYLCKS